MRFEPAFQRPSNATSNGLPTTLPTPFQPRSNGCSFHPLIPLALERRPGGGSRLPKTSNSGGRPTEFRRQRTLALWKPSRR